MKLKKSKIILLAGAITIATSPITIISLSCNDKKYNETAINYSTKDITFPTEDKTKNIDSILDDADINMFYAPGVQPFYETIRLAMLAKKQVMYYYSPEVHGMDFHNIIQKDTFEDFLQNQRKNEGKTEEEKAEIDALQKASHVISIPGKFFSSTVWDHVANAIKEDIKKYPNKKINVWVNSYHVLNKVWYQLAELNNVNMIALNDASSMLKNYHNDFEKAVKYYINQDTHKLAKMPITYSWSTCSYILMPNIMEKFHAFYNDLDEVLYFQKLGLNIKPYSYDKGYEIKNALFTARDKNNKRLSVEWWSKITGQDWRKEVKKVKDQKAKNGKKSLIYLGSSAEFVDVEKNHLLSLVNKYGKTHNIFYKGHPGIVHLEKWIEQEVNGKKELSYYDVFLKKQNKISIDENEQITTLFNQISSEELTTNHKDDPYFEKFDKWASAIRHTTALQKMLETNKIEDLALAGDSPEKLGKQNDIIAGDDEDKTTPAWIEFKKFVGYNG
ncbi:hypothetical protein MSATCC14277_2380 [Metamycoplasma salivarium]|uniref:hypothetical protein n=1 Tax=Metamycoplasma salivarium TaxID=2124 RepID=UPI001F454E64|nr:hypothetical protein [Metamycoplasma salivarium]GIZ05656.1 hypothetical protein MSATCC14277_2380 [Metamycoplasma salivarium]